MLPIDKIPPLNRIRPAEGVNTADLNKTQPKLQSNEFKNVFENALSEKGSISFSHHAQQRLHTRQIQLTPQQMDRLKTGVNQAAERGAKDSLVMMDNLAFIVSISNKTIVTALDGAAKNGNIFTNIDSAVIV